MNIKQSALDLGFDDCSIVATRELPQHRLRIEDWLANGYDSTLSYMRRNVDLRANPSLLVPQASSIIICLISYNQKPSQGELASRIASYAHSADYHKTIKGKLLLLIEAIKQHFPDSYSRAFIDSAPIFEKAWAVEAGLGWIGRNSLLIHPRLGSFTLIGTVITTATVDELSIQVKTPLPKIEDLCGECTLCVDSCPNSAILPNRTIDTNHCISRLTIERLNTEPKPVTASTESDENRKTQYETPHEIIHSTKLHGAIFGCDICQRCCPHNANAPILHHDIFAPIEQIESMTTERFLSLKETEFQEIFGVTPLSRSNLERLKNALMEK